MRIIPFMKRKKGVQFAGIGLDTGGGGGGSYVLPPATANTLGGVKVGQGLSVASDGTLSTDGGGGGGGIAYSTTEHAVGTWLDGSTVYERTFTGNISAGSQSSVDTGQINLRYLEVTSLVVGSDEIRPCAESAYSVYVDSYIKANGAIRVYSTIDGTYYITIKYVKGA